MSAFKVMKSLCSRCSLMEDSGSSNLQLRGMNQKWVKRYQIIANYTILVDM